MTTRQLAAGTILSGRYQLGEVLGESDLSTVYAASDQRGGAPVALKVFAPSVMTRPAALSEYQSQARHASGLGVEGIARAYDFGIDANSGVAFSTAERVPWTSLDRRVLAQGPLGAAELHRALTVLARALDAAHAGGIVHRQLKPQNIFISPDNPEWVRITDFGVSAVRRGAPEALGWGGPPGYTPPEAVDAASVATPATDGFALGVIAFFALTRGTPFRSLRHPAFDPNAHWSELNQPLTPVSERAKEIGVALDPAFDAWFARALALAPHERFRTAGEMARELGVIADQLSARGGGGPRSMPGIAAAIAQPLVFQPEPSPASLGRGGTVPIAQSPFANSAAPVPAAPAAPSVPSATAATATARASFGDDATVAGLPKKGGAPFPLLIGGGVLLLVGIAGAGYAAFRHGSESPAAEPSAAAAPAAEAPSAAVAAPPASAAEAAAPAESAAAPPAESAAPPATTAIAPAAPVAPKVAVAAKPAAAPAAAKPAPATSKSVAATAKPTPTTSKAAAAVTTKPAAPAPKASASAKTKKKCSTFLGCK
jgi:serine/threonine-protein kinase